MAALSGRRLCRSRGARSGRPPGLRTAARIGLAVLAAAVLAAAGAAPGAADAAAGAAPGAADAVPGQQGSVLSPLALGLNVAPKDGVYAAPAVRADVVQPGLRAAGIGLLRYGGGNFADSYDWQTNSNIESCLPGNATASYLVTRTGCATTDPLGFERFSALARVAGARSFVTVNYGSGTPAEAAAWVAHARGARGAGVALWEVGNESYGCWEVNNWLSRPPASFRGYTPDTYSVVNGHRENPTCPEWAQGEAAGTQTLADSYAVNARPFLIAMRHADPAAEVGVPWAFGSQVPGAFVADNAEWNDTVLGRDGSLVGFVDAHYYPFDFFGGTGGANPTDQQVLQALTAVPALYGQIRAELGARAPRAQVVIGETGVSNHETTTGCTPVGALFAAGDVLSWLSAGAVSVDWWAMHNYGTTAGTCAGPNYAMFTSGRPTVPKTPYYGYLLASVLARPHALLATMTTSDPADVLAYQSRLPGGSETVAFLNTDTAAARTVTFRPGAPLRGRLLSWSYSAGDQNTADSRIVRGTVPASSLAGGITLPAESLVILQAR